MLVEIGRQELAGTWQAETYALGGQKVPDEELKKVTLEIDAKGGAVARQDDAIFIAAHTTLDPTRQPMAIDIAYAAGDIEGQTALGIYKVEDDVLTICRAAPGRPRPAAFASDSGSGLTLMTYRRVKPAR